MNEMYTSIYEKLNVLDGLMKRQEMASQGNRGPFADTSRGQGRILAMLKIQPEIATRDLAYLLGIRQQSLNELLNKLEKGGYVIRKPSEADRRVMIVCLTDKGKETATGENDYPKFLECLTPEELETFGSYLDRIIAALKKDTPADMDEESWMNQARSRMGAGSFEQLMSMRDRAFGSFGSFERGGRPGSMTGFGPAGCPGSMGEGMPGAERFGADYDGPIPDRGPLGGAWSGKRPETKAEDMPGAERCSADYDGPIPDRGPLGGAWTGKRPETKAEDMPGAECCSADYDGPIPDRGPLGGARPGKRPETKADDMPGAERFSADYDGPVPDRGGFDFFGSRNK